MARFWCTRRAACSWHTSAERRHEQAGMYILAIERRRLFIAAHSCLRTVAGCVFTIPCIIGTMAPFGGD